MIWMCEAGEKRANWCAALMSLRWANNSWKRKLYILLSLRMTCNGIWVWFHHRFYPKLFITFMQSPHTTHLDHAHTQIIPLRWTSCGNNIFTAYFRSLSSWPTSFKFITFIHSFITTGLALVCDWFLSILDKCEDENSLQGQDIPDELWIT